MVIRTFKPIVAFILCIILTHTATAAAIETTCLGNIESFDRKIVQAGVTYLLQYEISGTKAKISFAGHDLVALVDTGTSWKGRWIKRIENNEYFSFLPDDGGTIKFQLEPNLWFSGNCRTT
jgi:hypothetical protein